MGVLFVHGVGELMHVEGSLDYEALIELLDDTAVPYMQGIFPQDTFLSMITLPLTSHTTKDFLTD